MRGYPCIGGPLDGRSTTRQELRAPLIAVRDFGSWRAGDVISPGGSYAEFSEEYIAYNRAGTRGPTMIWLHKGLLLP